MTLTDPKVKNAKPIEKAYRLYDKDGLYLQVQPNGSKYWRWKYRFVGKEKVLALGIYGSENKHLSLKEARNIPVWMNGEVIPCRCKLWI
ncbi:MAG: hypothetical protein ACJA04_000745 [Cellvibrionaceae bacterium]|jgi:hypothetical protein